MILLDTHAWIWLASESELLSRRAHKEIKVSARLALAAISLWEMSMLADKGRLELDRPVLEWIEQSLEEHDIQLLPLTPAIAVRATQLGKDFHRDPADRMIVATAQVYGASIISKDSKIRMHGQVPVIW